MYVNIILAFVRVYSHVCSCMWRQKSTLVLFLRTIYSVPVLFFVLVWFGLFVCLFFVNHYSFFKNIFKDLYLFNYI